MRDILSSRQKRTTHYRCESRYCNPSGNEKGSVENAVGFLRRNLLVPAPSAASLAELNAMLRLGCERINASRSCPGRGARARPSATPPRSYRRSWPGRARSASRPSAGTCRRRSWRRSTGAARPTESRAAGDSPRGRAVCLSPRGRSSPGSRRPAAERPFASGRVPDDASCDLLARRAAGSSGPGGRADLCLRPARRGGGPRCRWRFDGRGGGGGGQARCS